MNVNERKFSKEYFFNAIVQEKQNKKFFNFLVSVINEYQFPIRRICEVGVGNCELARWVSKYFFLKNGEIEAFYLIDNNEDFVNIGKSLRGINICKNFLNVEEGDFVEGKPDLIYSTNTFHWFPFNEKDDAWIKAVEKVYNFLEEGGFFILHQGLRWSYIFLYELTNELFEKLYGMYVDKRKYLFYPHYKELTYLLKEAGFRIVSGKEFFETDLTGTASYDIEELLRSFLVAGLNVFLWELEDKEERENFKKLFYEYCKLYEPPLLAHRAFVAMRKPLENYQVIQKKRGSLLSFEVKEIEEFLAEVADDFVPSLRVRSPNDKVFDNVDKGGVSYYLEGLIKGGNDFILLKEKKEGKLIGLLSYRVMKSLIRSKERVIYVPIIAVRRQYRGLGLSKVLYNFLFKISREILKEDKEVKGIETRTWHTNEKIKKVLESLGFELVAKLENHRGEGIDTEYYFLDRKKLEN